MRWLRDTSLHSLIGFSGTLAASRRELESLGLEVAASIPSAELIAPMATSARPTSGSTAGSRRRQGGTPV